MFADERSDEAPYHLFVPPAPERSLSAAVRYRCRATFALALVVLAWRAEWRPPNDVQTMSTLNQGQSRLTKDEKQQPPSLCYEFVARVTRREVLTEGDDTSNETSTFVLDLSRDRDVVGKQSPPKPPFEKEFQSFVVADPYATGAQRDRCVHLSLMPFFGSTLCDVFPGKNASKREHAGSTAPT